METNFDDFETHASQRPSFLTVLCILTFIGSGWAILSSVWSYTAASKFSKNIIEIKRTGRDTVAVNDSVHLKDTVDFNKAKHSREFGEKMQASFSQMLSEDNIRKNAIGGIIASLFTLSGALLMWRLKRLGFYIYIVGVIIAGAIPFYLYGSNFLAVGISFIW